MAVKDLALRGSLCYIYIMECDGFHKVGWALEPPVRLSLLQIGCPHEIKLIEVFPVPGYDAHAVEAAAHRLLKGRKHRGEWFDAGLSDVRQAVVRAYQKLGVPLLSMSEVEGKIRDKLAAKAAAKARRVNEANAIWERNNDVVARRNKLTEAFFRLGGSPIDLHDFLERNI